ncbi:nucleotidyltransferase family protein [Evansella cellulosilytica]|uniref:4-diphosphocytidyl-2C-methyl-D-erythritol synthase n=1 Tax=Evansella cellulosilytica (strain ATCC 21833 / DSM 2522 / FERM P-1141 / JCM 9156 / N-4) TaxID=649639 RepID=E6U1B4_EVAC2|nr:nucleotidyltransferase family protein [Evansella cellulosilytica]ADU29161.1 4-diphosphocytidyl-2C-methyl-D-erythritol synthase [Evansella cellulosilytica DSM 2522]
MIKEDISAIILAAGTSTRMGTEKQLLPIRGQLMLEHVIETVNAHRFKEIVVIVGHKGNEIRQAVRTEDDRLRWVMNDHFVKGQSTSFNCGINSVTKTIPSAIVFLADQPFISKETISTIILKGRKLAEKKTDPYVIRPLYNGQQGHPVFIGNVHQLPLPFLASDKGGKVYIEKIKTVEKLEVNDPNVVFDIDTKEDYEHVIKKK